MGEEKYLKPIVTFPLEKTFRKDVANQQQIEAIHLKILFQNNILFGWKYLSSSNSDPTFELFGIKSQS